MTGSGREIEAKIDFATSVNPGIEWPAIPADYRIADLHRYGRLVDHLVGKGFMVGGFVEMLDFSGEENPRRLVVVDPQDLKDRNPLPEIDIYLPPVHTEAKFGRLRYDTTPSDVADRVATIHLSNPISDNPDYADRDWIITAYGAQYLDKLVELAVTIEIATFKKVGIQLIDQHVIRGHDLRGFARE